MSKSNKSILDNLFDSWIYSNNYPGIVTGLFNKRGDEVYYYENNAKHVNKKYNRDTIFRIYSMTKPITALATLLLIERNILKLDDKISKYIPAFESTQVLIGGTVDNPITESIKTPITILHLLTHTSGICYALFANQKVNDQILTKYLQCDLFDNYRDIPTSTLCDYVAKTPLSFQPGTGFEYGLNFDILGYIIEIVTNTKLNVFLKNEIFISLDMLDTDFYIPCNNDNTSDCNKNNITRLADCYDYKSCHSYTLSTSLERRRDALPINLAGGAGLLSTLSDYSKLTTCLLNKGLYKDKRIFSENTVSLLTTNQLPNQVDMENLLKYKGFLEYDGGGFGFGLGVYVITNPLKAPGGILSGQGEYGWGGVASTAFYIDPINEISFIFMTQLVPSTSYPLRSHMRYLTHLFYQKEKEHNHIDSCC